MVQSTHDVTLGDVTVVKRFRSWDRGEPDLEWRGLKLLHRFSPGLAPEPLERRTEDGAPLIVMTRLPGEPLGAAPLTPEQIAGLGLALRRMHNDVPADVLARVPARRWGAAELAEKLRSDLRDLHQHSAPVVDMALAAAGDWISRKPLRLDLGMGEPRAFTQADGNLGNFLWDGETCRVVDFEDSGGSEPAYEVADLLEHVSVWVPNLVDAGDLVGVLELSAEQERRLTDFRRLFAIYWLLMLLPGNRAHGRNPPGTLNRQADRLLQLL